jgi:serine/threonine protein phosphatase PrpC/CRP-like cAMP-binding protein
MTLVVSALSDVGRVRQNNEDNFFSAPARGLFIVADGMGGHNAGEVASEMAVRLISEALLEHEPLRERFAAASLDEDAALLRAHFEEAVRTAGRAIFERAKNDPACAGMGTTCSAIWLAGRKGFLAHVGDSRVYVARKTGLYQLSEDHTFVADQLRRGLINEEEAKHSRYANVLTRALGVTETAPIDVLIFDVDPGDRFLVCSDGAHNYFKSTQELAKVLSEKSAEEGTKYIIETAKERGGHDNVTAIVVQVEGDDVPDGDLAAQRIAILRRIPIFSHLTYQEVVKVVSMMSVRRLQPKVELIREGAIGDELYVILSGEMTVISGGTVMASLHSGTHVGEMALIDRAPRSATVVSNTAVNLLAMDRAGFYDLLRREPLIGAKLLWAFTQVLSARLRTTNANLRQAIEELDERARSQSDQPFPVVDIEDA